MGYDTSDYNGDNTECSSCECRINPDNSDSIECCQNCNAYFCIDCFISRENEYDAKVCDDCAGELITSGQAHLEAFEALSSYYYSLDRNNTNNDNYRLRIYTTGAADVVVYDDRSSDYFTLMQYFYKWEKTTKFKHRK